MHAACPRCSHPRLDTRSLVCELGPMCLVSTDATMFPTADGRAVEMEWTKTRSREDLGLALSCPACPHFEVVVPVSEAARADLADQPWVAVDDALSRWLDPQAWPREPAALPDGEGPWVLDRVELVEEHGAGWDGLTDAERAEVVSTGTWTRVFDLHDDTGTGSHGLATALSRGG